MSVEKAGLQSVQPETKQTFQGKKSVQSDIRESHDLEKRNAAKLMKGAAALAVVAAAGIIGHKLGKIFSKNVENALDEVSGIVTDAVRKAEKQSTEAVKSTNKAAEKVKPSVTETVEQTTAKPVQNNAEKVVKETEKTVENLSKSKSLDELAEEALKAGKKTFEKEYYYNYSRLIKTFDAKTRKLLEERLIDTNGGIRFTNKYDYDPKTGNLLKLSSFDNKNGQIRWILDYDPKTEKIVKDTDFLGYEKLIHYYDPKTGNLLKQMSFREDGSISSIGVYDAKTGHFIKSTQFYEDGKTVKRIEEYDPKTKNIIPTSFDRDGNEKW